MGTPEFALPALEMLCACYPVVGVVTQPDRPAGRGQQLAPSPVKQMAEAEGIRVFQPRRLRDLEAIERVRAWSPDLIVVAAFGQLVPQAILEMPPHGVLNIHPSLLPRWRGAAPIQGAILAGDTVTGVTIMKMDEGFDTGPIVAQRETAIDPQETGGALSERLAQLGAELLLEVIPDYLAGRLTPMPQPEEGVTSIRRLDKEQACIDWNQPAVALSNQVRAFAPKPSAYTTWRGERLKVLQAEATTAVPVPEGPPGVVFIWEDKPAVITGEDALVLLQLQMAGKRPMNGSAFLRGKGAIVGDALGT